MFTSYKKFKINESNDDQIVSDFISVLNEYTDKRNVGVDIIERMFELIEELKEYDNSKFLYWIKNGSTLYLKELLENTTYRGNGNAPEQLLDFNSFATLDTIGMYYREKYEI